MNANLPYWDIQLGNRPQLPLIGIFSHGQKDLKPSHYLKALWCVHLYTYSAVLWIEGKPFPIEPGSVSVIPAGIHFDYHLKGPSIHWVAHFKLSTQRNQQARIPAIQDLGNDFTALTEIFKKTSEIFPLNPLRAEVRLWEILWHLAARSQNSETHRFEKPSRHPAVEKAITLIELRLTEPISIKKLAAEVHLSSNHLTRLFQIQCQSTVVGYIRKRRVERAKHLLLHTSSPIKSIAAEVGIPDLHLFNKTIRRAFGHSPREIRKQNKVIL